MGIRNTTKEKHDLTLGRRISAAAKRLLPADRRSDVGGDAQETSKANQPAELVLSVLKMWENKMRRSFCPPLAIRYGSPDRRIKEKRMEDTFKSLDRAARSFLTAYAILAGVNVTLLPEGQSLNFLLVVGPTTIMAFAIRLHWKSWGPAGLEDSVCKDPDERFLEQLKRWIDILLDGTFSPAEAMVRSALEALSVMFMYLIPVYATLQFSAARNYSVNVTWSGILGRYAFATLLTFLFVHLRKANRLAGGIFQDELRARKPLGTPLNA